MKYSKSILLFVSVIILYMPANAFAFTPNINCTHDSLEAFSTWMYKNFYHGHHEPIPKFESWDIWIFPFWNMKGYTGIKWIWYDHITDKCFIPKEGYPLLSDETTEFLKYVKVERIIPLYMPREKYPIGFYTILVDTQKSLWDEEYIQRASVSSNGYRRLFPRFLGWNYITQKPTSAWMKNVQAYLKSREEPFVSAPVLQMYWYLSQPLLVARDENGKVFSVFFQWRDIPNPMERAKLYLWSEWEKALE